MGEVEQLLFRGALFLIAVLATMVLFQHFTPMVPEGPQPSDLRCDSYEPRAPDVHVARFWSISGHKEHRKTVCHVEATFAAAEQLAGWGGPYCDDVPADMNACQARPELAVTGEPAPLAVR